MEKTYVDMMIQMNGKSCELKGPMTISELLGQYHFSNQRIAVELNRKILSRHRFSTTYVENGDKLEIVTAIGGG